jgi:hypothetical protein
VKFEGGGMGKVANPIPFPTSPLKGEEMVFTRSLELGGDGASF